MSRIKSVLWCSVVGRGRLSGRMMSFLSLLAGLFLLAGLTSTATAAVPRAILTEALGMVRAGQAEAAYQRLRNEEARQGGDPEFDYVFGLAALESGRPAEAVRILSRLNRRRPDLLPPRAELGRAYLTLGDLPAARDTFSGIAGDPRLPRQVRDTLGRYIQDIDRILDSRRRGTLQPGQTRVGGFGEVRVGYDSNVNAATNEREILIPFFAALGPALINPAGRARADAFVEASAGISIVRALTGNSALYMNLVGSGKLHARANDFDAGIIGAELGYAHDFAEAGRLTIAGVAQSHALDYRAFRHAAGLAGLWTRTTESGFTLTVAANYLFLSYVGADARDAHRFTAGLTLGQRFATAGNIHAYVQAQAGMERSLSAATDHFSHDLLQIRAGIDVPIYPNLSLFSSASVEWRDFRADFPLFFFPRFDREYAASIGLDYQLGEGMRLRPVINYTYVRSNIALFNQSRIVVSVAFRKEF
jgi:hypothetical protein